ncbi:MAG: hypothetical protein ABI520_00295 [Caldimonas sp.]
MGRAVLLEEIERTLSTTMKTMMAKLVTSPVAAEIALAARRMSSRGLRKRFQSWRASGRADA